MFKKKNLPQGVITLKTLTMPKHANVNGNVFGGWIMSKIDIGGSILAKEISGGKVVTAKIDTINFLKPIFIGDIVYCYAKCVNIGNSSMKINLELWIKKIHSRPFGQFYCCTKAVVIYVAIDNFGKSRLLLPMSVL